MILARSIWFLLLLALTGCASPDSTFSGTSDNRTKNDFGVLLMAHGGSSTWNEGVLSVVEPLREQYLIEVAFGMADAVSIQEAIQKLEARGVRKIGVVRLFVSGESWYERTEQILGLRPGAPARPAMVMSGMHKAGHGGYTMEFWQAQTEASFALSVQGLAEAPGMEAVLIDRAGVLSTNPQREDVLILAHGPADDAENERWIAHIQARSSGIMESFPFRRVQVETLREDWPEKRAEAEQRIRAFVARAQSDGGTALVIPFRVQGFGPYAEVLADLDYISDGQGLVPHPNVTQWIATQITTLQRGPFRSALP